MGLSVHTVMSMGDKAKGMKAVLYGCFVTARSDEENYRLARQFSRCACCTRHRDMEFVAAYVDETNDGMLSLTLPILNAALADLEEGKADAFILIVQKGQEDESIMLEIKKRVILARGTMFFDHYLSFKEPDGNEETGNNNIINAISLLTPREFQEGQNLMVKAMSRVVHDIYMKKPHLWKEEVGDASDETTAPEAVNSPKPPARKSKMTSMKMMEPKKEVIPASNPDAMILY